MGVMGVEDNRSIKLISAGSNYFSIPIFFIIFRETTEAAIIVSVLLSFLSQVITDDDVMRKGLSRQVRGRGICHA
jgi:high-affinity Fe2+/Pb2+ permease